ncbi:MAG: hypothetical protein ACOX8T_00395 [Bacillota bacterium]
MYIGNCSNPPEGEINCDSVQMDNYIRVEEKKAKGQSLFLG